LGNIVVVLLALGIGGILLIIFEHSFKKKIAAQNIPPGVNIESISYKKAFFVGIFQSVAMIPGVSRSAATIIGGMLMNISRETIVEFSFLLAVPTLLAATGLALFKNPDGFYSSDYGILAIGFIASFLTAIASIKFLLRYIKGHTFTSFGVYRIVLALAFIFIL
jgi:undecaprenyl-diphosphatase